MDGPMSDLDKKNIAYWDELCGTNLAKAIGVTDNAAASLQRFDDWFFAFYPYLFGHVRLNELSGLDVLEVGLGYGSLSQKIAESGARYTGLDVAKGPVEMVRHRLKQAGLWGTAVQGSILTAPFADRSFDRVITIGCLHHTGEMRGAVNECRRLLRGGGLLTVMVYYAYSYRRWTQARKQTLKYLRAELFGYRGTIAPLSESETWSYDHNKNGAVAPHTDFISVKSLRYLFRPFATFEWKLRNIAQEAPFMNRTRDVLLNTRWPDFCGLEIYATAKK
jgi:SAM-dependent methyltransferase